MDSSAPSPPLLCPTSPLHLAQKLKRFLFFPSRLVSFRFVLCAILKEKKNRRYLEINRFSRNEIVDGGRIDGC